MNPLPFPVAPEPDEPARERGRMISMDSAMRAADRACYAAKRKGRNRVEVLADAMD